MDAMERRCQIIEILCDAKMRIKMRDVASRFNVSIRTIRTDVDVLSLTYPHSDHKGTIQWRYRFHRWIPAKECAPHPDTA